MGAAPIAASIGVAVSDGGALAGPAAEPFPQATRIAGHAVRSEARTSKPRVTRGREKMQIGRGAFSVKKAMNLGPRARVVFGASWIASQVALVLSAGERPDRIFGFRMFPEASTLEVHLIRETSAGDVTAPRGEWSALDAVGQLRHFSWHDRVRDPVLGAVDATVFASYGVATQLARLQRALDDVAAHIDQDGETRRLRAHVVFSRNGHDAQTVELTSQPRWGG